MEFCVDIMSFMLKLLLGQSGKFGSESIDTYGLKLLELLLCCSYLLIRMILVHKINGQSWKVNMLWCFYSSLVIFAFLFGSFTLK